VATVKTVTKALKKLSKFYLGEKADESNDVNGTFILLTHILYANNSIPRSAFIKIN
jgi:hypothetical protein